MVCSCSQYWELKELEKHEMVLISKLTYFSRPLSGRWLYRIQPFASILVIKTFFEVRFFFMVQQTSSNIPPKIYKATIRSLLIEWRKTNSFFLTWTKERPDYLKWLVYYCAPWSIVQKTLQNNFFFFLLLDKKKLLSN